MASEDDFAKLIFLLINNWRDTRTLTIDLIDSVSVKPLNKKLPRPGLNTIAKQIYEMADVEEAYIQALIDGKLDFSKTTNGNNIKGIITPQQLRLRLQRSDTVLYKTVKHVRNWNKKIQIFGKTMPKYTILELMTRHETLHHGQFVAYGYLPKINFPNSWVNTWAISQPNVKK